MSGYEVEHNISPHKAQEAPRRRPDLSTFFGSLEFADTSGARQPHNANSIPLPQDIANTFRHLASAFDMMRGDTNSAQDRNHNELLDELVQTLMRSADDPPVKIDGVSDEFIEQLERVPKKELKADQSCPICANPFLEDTHPLVVRLPCHDDHLFDLECIQPWLKLNPTCPLDRKTLIKKKPPPSPPDDEDGEYDDMYA